VHGCVRPVVGVRAPNRRKKSLAGVVEHVEKKTSDKC
jgi:hypothetical protein